MLLLGRLIVILSRDRRAVGVEYVENPRIHSNTNCEISVARAKRLVVISAGSFGSPCILERSGIGAKSVLGKHGIEQLVDLPGVGENYQGRSLPLSLHLTGLLLTQSCRPSTHLLPVSC